MPMTPSPSSRAAAAVALLLLAPSVVVRGFFAPAAVAPRRRDAAAAAAVAARRAPPPPPHPRRWRWRRGRSGPRGAVVVVAASSSPPPSPRRSSPSSSAEEEDGDPSWPIPPLTFEVELGGGGGGGEGGDDAAAVLEVVTLAGTGDVERAVRDCLRRATSSTIARGDDDEMDEEEGEQLRSLFAELWERHAAAVRTEHAAIRASARPHEGPRPANAEDYSRSVVASIPVSRGGFVLEVADSTVSGAGRGVFLRPTTDDDDGGSGGGERRRKTVWQVGGSAFCGYADGAFANRLDGACDGGVAIDGYKRDRTFEFRLDDGPESTVWFRGAIATIADVVASTGATRLVGHDLAFGSTDGGRRGALEGVRPRGEDEDDEDDDRGGGDGGGAFRYFVPRDDGDGGDCEDVTIRTLGRFANDLAMAGGKGAPQNEGDYLERSRAANALVLVPRIDLAEEVDEGGTAAAVLLRPSGGPILTVRETIRIDADRDEPMEMGCEYGYHYWEDQRMQEEEEEERRKREQR